ncbi:copper resistance protein CopC [Corynebacterium sp. 153RC1]|uniref:copper resistance CopC family protein n=1 Tax=unclassified Corynebacterium TaxID=2624378 RepID=UPI00211C6621|nr:MULTISPECIES: copper resistance CopC family protein [unclassified Corynebacterium]MCQ9371224.1 copper resistance protein CopC [Corynebacterium sp. 35RC1]MCQ9351515.1 copper resistance protein CopC [Corynebacterium sp. 209RC1]MCQ9354644.1 copper resistance protein CopC [Corynebacterium sp. 1222RC1]MCQ9357504.1 copper resistance protein CopC [Corynebacterium sp. 122RC1]MCQ9358042.1 copper resistance protein CopC [Corynebacterium sp. 142RC1]
MGKRFTGAVAATAVLWAGSFGAGIAAAHDSVLSTSPEAGTTVEAFPETISFVFSGEVQDGFNTIAVTDQAQGRVVFEGEPAVEGQNVSIEVPEDLQLSPGTYTVGYQITSSDGHATRGSFEFSYAGAATETNTESAPAPAPTASEETPSNQDMVTSESGSNLPLILGAAVAIFAAAGVAAVVLRRPKL